MQILRRAAIAQGNKIVNSWPQKSNIRTNAKGKNYNEEIEEYKYQINKRAVRLKRKNDNKQ